MSWYPTDTRPREAGIALKSFRKMSSAVRWVVLIGLCGLGWRRDNIAWLFFYGILLFSGSLYMRALGAGPLVLILSVPGALLLLLGWLTLAWSSLTSPRG